MALDELAQTKRKEVAAMPRFVADLSLSEKGNVVITLSAVEQEEVFLLSQYREYLSKQKGACSIQEHCTGRQNFSALLLPETDTEKLLRIAIY